MKHVLIAEDNALLVKMYQRFFVEEKLDDVTIDIALDGREAMKKIDEHQPDLLLLDLLMPEADGYEVLEHRLTKGHTFPVVILSNLSQNIDQKRCSELGAKDYFVKSDMDLLELGGMIRKHLK